MNADTVTGVQVAALPPDTLLHTDWNAEAGTSTGAVRGTRNYDAFGYRKDATSFRLVGHRLYDPVAGRFLSRDPIRDGSNWYAYVSGDPVNGADPTGLFGPIVVAPIILGVGVAAIGLAFLVRLGHELNKIGGPATQDKREPGSDLYGNDEKLGDRLREQNPQWIQETRKVATDQYVDLYIGGPLGTAGGDGVKIILEGYKQYTDYRTAIQ